MPAREPGAGSETSALLALARGGQRDRPGPRRPTTTSPAQQERRGAAPPVQAPARTGRSRTERGGEPLGDKPKSELAAQADPARAARLPTC